MSSESGAVALSYSQVEVLLSEMHAVPPQNRGALRARLKHLKRNNFPIGVNTGRGKSFEYDGYAILSLLLVFELLQLGITPERALAMSQVETAKRAFAELTLDVNGEVSLGASIPQRDALYISRPMALRGLTADPNADSVSDWFSAVDVATFASAFQYSDERFVVVNLSNLMRRADSSLRGLGFDRSDIQKLFTNWHSDDSDPQT